MLKLVVAEVDETSSPDTGEDLREALKPLTKGTDPGNWRYVLLEGEAEALCRALDNKSLTAWQIEQLVSFLREVDPLKGPAGGGWNDNRLSTFVSDAIGLLADERWLQGPLDRLDRQMRAVVREGGKNFFCKPMLRAAVIKILTTPAHAPSDSATG